MSDLIRRDGEVRDEVKRHNAGIGRVLGFAMLVECPDGGRIMVYSDEVDDSLLAMYPGQTPLDVPSEKRAPRYYVELDASSLNFAVDDRPIRRILERRKALKQKGDT